MLKKILLALIFVISAITNVTYAEDDMKTVASKAYVDTKIETKQLKIPAAGQPNVGAGETVMTYTSTGNGQIGERGLYSDISSYDATTDADKLITASALNATFTNLPTTDTTKLECANQNDGCTLWTIVDQTAYARGLPDGYTQLEYIESTGTQYIDTNTVPSSTELRIETSFIPQTYAENINMIAGTVVQTPLDAFLLNSRVLYLGGNNQCTYENSSSIVGKTVVYNGAFSATSPRRNLSGTINGVSFSKSTDEQPIDTSAITSAIRIFGHGNNYRSALKMHYFKVYNSNTLVADFIPAKRNSDNVLGMYDTISGTFFTNSGTGNFAGPPAN